MFHVYCIAYPDRAPVWFTSEARRDDASGYHEGEKPFLVTLPEQTTNAETDRIVAEAPAARLEYLRGELRGERISMGELIELQSLAEHIDPGDVELLEAAGVPEFPDGDGPAVPALRLVLDVSYENVNCHPRALRHLLEAVVEQAVNRGGITGDLDAEVKEWSYRVETIEPTPDPEDKHATVAAAVEAAINAGARVIQAAFGVKHGDTAGHYFADGSMCADHLRAVFADYFDTEQRAVSDDKPERKDFTPAPHTFPIRLAHDNIGAEMPPHLAREGYRLECDTVADDGASDPDNVRYWWTLCRGGDVDAGDDFNTPADAIADAETDCARELARGSDAFTG